MSKIAYSKVPLTFEQQLKQLQERGLIIEDVSKAVHLLSQISYYRLSAYWYPLLSDKANHIFKPNANLQAAFRLYCFDRELRKLVSSEIEKIEVSIRTQIIYVLSHKHGPFWFVDSSIFKNKVRHKESLLKIDQEYKRSDEQFILAFKNKYINPYPPCWMTMEITSFGMLSQLYKNLLPGREKREIAHHYGISDSVLETLLHSIVYLRNVCAHHTRLWNRVMRIQPQFPRAPKNQWLNNPNVSNNRTYFILSIIIYLLNVVNANHTFKNKFGMLLDKYPNVDLAAMGFPKDWKNEHLWN
ncbi:MAG TPA: Abi family protein [Flavipsychrobacter sp.]|nr:Abi family protein [Flavipsychrobacter sp.]